MGAFWFVFSLSLFLLSTWFCYRENETRGGLGPVQYLMRLVTAPGERQAMQWQQHGGTKWNSLVRFQTSESSLEDHT